MGKSVTAVADEDDNKPARDKGERQDLASLPSFRDQDQALPPLSYLAVPWWPQSDSSRGILLGLHGDVIMGLGTRR
jgi:hypothetical protein